MAVSLDKKLDLIRKANATLKKEKISNLLAQASKIDSYSAENQQKIKSNVDSLYNQIAEAYKKKQQALSSTSKPASKNRKKPKKEDTMMGYASMVMKRDNVSWKEALKKSKDHFASIRSKKQDEEQKALDDFKKKVGDVEFERATKYKTKKGTKGTDIERDKVRPALPSGKRIVRTKGQTTNQYGTFKNKIGKVYYEKRANRMDVNQPSKSVYPKLADGGQSGGVNVFDNIFEDYGFTKKRGAYGIKVFYNKEKNIYAQYDMERRQLSVDDKDLPFSIRHLIDHLKSLGLTEKKYAKGGKIKGFDNLAKKVARSYKGKRVKAKYQDEYGKTYDSKEAMEVGKKVASKVYRQQLAKKGMMAKGGKVGKAHWNLMQSGDTIESDEGFWENYENATQEDLKPSYGRYKGYQWVETAMHNGMPEGFWEKVEYAKGGQVAKDFDVVVRLPKGLVTKKDFDGFSKDEIIQWCEEKGWKYNAKGEKFGGQVLKNYEFFVKEFKRVNVGLLPNKKHAKGGKLKIGNDDFSFLLELTDKELERRLDLVQKQQKINSQQYFQAREKGENTSKIEESGERLQKQERAIIEARLKKYAKGGEISEGNYDMAKNQAKELCHHANELHSVLKKEKHIEAWVISKLERATSDLSDVTHYLDGLSEQHKD